MDNKNFNLTTSVSTPIEYFKILILQRLNDLCEAYESYYKQKGLGTETSLNIIHARTNSLYLALLPYLKRKNIATDDINKKLFEHEPNEKSLIEIFILINTQLDTDRLTRMDTKAVYDGTRTEVENDAKGL